MKINIYKFHCARYASTFDFCTREEKIRIACVLQSAWNKYKPIRDNERDVLDIVHDTAKRVNGYLHNKTEKDYGK